MLNHLRFWERIKQEFWWYVIYPVFPYLQKALVALRIIHHRGRQPWRIGWVVPHRTLKEFYRFAHTKGFANHFIAWQDDGQLVSLRRREGFKYQYHLRVFNDGEVRGHYEETPEDHPIAHFDEKVFQPRTADFRRWLGNWVVDKPPAEPGKMRFHSAPATSLEAPENG